MDNETEELVNRALYKQIKSMNRAEMETFVRNVFAQGYQRAEEETHPIDYDSLSAERSSERSPQLLPHHRAILQSRESRCCFSLLRYKSLFRIYISGDEGTFLQKYICHYRRLGENG